MSLGRELAVYTVLRVGLTITVGVTLFYGSALLGVHMPLIMAALLAVIIQLPLAWLLLTARGHRVNELLAQRRGRRRQQLAQYRAELESED